MANCNRKAIDQKGRAVSIDNEMPKKHGNRMKPSIETTFTKDPWEIVVFRQKYSGGLDIAAEKPRGGKGYGDNLS